MQSSTKNSRVVYHLSMGDQQPQKLFPMLSLLVAATLWGVSWYPLRLLEQVGFSGLWTAVIVYGIPMIIGLIVYFRILPEIRRHPWLLLIVLLGNGWCNVSFIVAVLDGEIMRVLLLFYLSPLWTTILGWIFLGEHLSRLSLVTLIIAMVGAMVMLWDPSIGAPWPTNVADWLAISSGLTFSAANVSLRRLQDVSLRVKTIVSWAGVTAVALLWIVAIDHQPPSVAGEVWLWVTLLGPIVVVAMTFSVFYGVTHLPVHRSAVILLFELVIGAISSQLLTHEVITASEWVGGSLIMLAAYLSARTMMSESGVNQG